MDSLFRGLFLELEMPLGFDHSDFFELPGNFGFPVIFDTVVVPVGS